MPYGFTASSQKLDMLPRFYTSSTIVGSPALAAETLVAQITGIDGQLSVSVGVFLSAALSFTVGTSGTAIRVRIRQGTTAGAGTVIADTGGRQPALAGHPEHRHERNGRRGGCDHELPRLAAGDGRRRDEHGLAGQHHRLRLLGPGA